MNKKSIKFTSKDIINKREDLCKTKTKYWRYIASENVLPTKNIKAGQYSGFDLKELYNQITQMADNLIKIKLMLNAINNGETKFDYDKAKKTHYYNIYRACELKEQLAHWEEIAKKHTLNPVAKKKAGGKGLGKTETFSIEKITAIKNKLQLEINKVDAAIAKFNDETTLDITDTEFDTLSLAA